MRQGLAARKHILDVRVGKFGGFSWGVSLTEAERRRGYQVRGIHFGPLIYWVRGPAVQDNMFRGIDIPAALITLLGAKPGTDVGFALPVHAPDRHHGQPALLLSEAREPILLTVASDIDAAVRATLYDEAPSRISATLGRVVGKQVAAQATANAVEEESGKLAGFLTRLITSSVATATEVADTRCWTLLPNVMEAALIDLPAGSQPLRLQLNDGRVADLGEVMIQPGQLNIVRYRSFPAQLSLSPDHPHAPGQTLLTPSYP